MNGGKKKLFKNSLADASEKPAKSAATEREKIEILESITDAFVSLDRAWRYTYLNSAAEKLLQKPADELLGKCLWDVFPEAVGTKADEEYRRAVETGKSAVFEMFYEPFQSWLEIRAYPTPSGLSIYWQDITRRKRAEEIEREKNQLLEQTYDAIFIWDIEDGITFWHPNAERLFGFSESEAKGKESHVLLKTVFPMPHAQFIEILRNKEFWEGELIQTTKSGDEVITESRLHVIKRNDEKFDVLETLRDVTERRQIEAKLARAAQLSLVGELAAGLAHEIKNPLAGIKGVIDILLQRRQAEGDGEREILESVSKEIERIDKTVRALLLHARPRPLEIKPAPLDETIRRAVQFAFYQTSISRTRGVKIPTELNLPETPFMMPHDSASIEDAILNLLLNARDAVGDKKDGKITVRLSKNSDANEAFIEITDNGCGIPIDKLERIFTPFQTTKKDGTGLGLAAVRRIARAHGGNCEARSTVGKETTFTIRLPFKNSDER